MMNDPYHPNQLLSQARRPLLLMLLALLDEMVFTAGATIQSDYLQPVAIANDVQNTLLDRYLSNGAISINAVEGVAHDDDGCALEVPVVLYESAARTGHLSKLTQLVDHIRSACEPAAVIHAVAAPARIASPDLDIAFTRLRLAEADLEAHRIKFIQQPKLRSLALKQRRRLIVRAEKRLRQMIYSGISATQERAFIEAFAGVDFQGIPGMFFARWTRPLRALADAQDRYLAIASQLL